MDWRYYQSHYCSGANHLLMFMKLLDDNQLKAEANANLLGVPQKSKVFQDLCDQREPPCGNRI